MAGRATAWWSGSEWRVTIDQREAKSHWPRRPISGPISCSWTSEQTINLARMDNPVNGQFKQSDKVTSHNKYECMDLCCDGDDL
jgi:hypothetical protein